MTLQNLVLRFNFAVSHKTDWLGVGACLGSLFGRAAYCSLVRCSCACKLHRLAQSVWPGVGVCRGVFGNRFSAAQPREMFMRGSAAQARAKWIARISLKSGCVARSSATQPCISAVQACAMWLARSRGCVWGSLFGRAAYCSRVRCSCAFQRLAQGAWPVSRCVGVRSGLAFPLCSLVKCSCAFRLRRLARSGWPELA